MASELAFGSALWMGCGSDCRTWGSNSDETKALSMDNEWDRCLGNSTAPASGESAFLKGSALVSSSVSSKAAMTMASQKGNE